ncbi:MAG: flagellar biosynthesis protein FlgH [Desulfocapsa sp.]|nr:MAG: flagellar biosynthesis protein FlgH [Desulfocapsa sp.]
MRYCNTFIIFLLFVILLTSCAKNEDIVMEMPEPLEEIQTNINQERTDGSLWPGEQHSIYADHKARAVGDIVTLTISESASATKKATTATDRTTSMTAGIPHLFGLENSKWLTEHPKVDISNLVEANFANSFSGSGTTTRTEDLVASLTAQVIDVYPNGNLKIRGGKEVQVNNEIQVIYVTGIVRPVDIMADNTINSKYVLNAKISYTGKGAISDKQKPGWLLRTFDNIWPF